MRVVQTRQPVGPIRLNRSNPLTAGLIDVFVAGHRVNLVSGLSLAATHTSSFVGVSQLGVSLTSSASGPGFYSVGAAPAGIRVDEATMLAVTAPSATADTARSIYGYGWTGGANPLMFIGQSGTANQLYFFVRSDAGTAQSPTVAPPSGTWAQDQRAVLVGARSQSKNVHELYVNGIQAATTTATTLGTTTLNTTSVGSLRRTSDGTPYTGKTSLCLAWNRCLSAAEIKSISDNPWQIFEPIVVPVKTASSGVSGSGSPTNANDTSAGTGTTTVVGTSSTTNANDTSAGTGTTTVTGTVNYTNNNDTCAGSGTAGAITGTVNYTNNNDTAVGTGWAGIVTGTVNYTNRNDTSSGVGLVVGRGGITGDARKKRRYVAKIGDRLVVFDSADRALNAIQRDDREPDAPVVVPAKKTPPRLPKDAETVQAVQVKDIQTTARVYEQEQRVMDLFRKQRYAEMVALYQALRNQEDDDEIELLMLA